MYNYLFILFIACNSSMLVCKDYKAIIFIHGTFQAGCTLFNLRHALNDNFNQQTWYERTIELSRTQGFAEKSDLMLGLGLIDITQDVHAPQFSPYNIHKAAFHIVRTFNTIVQAIQPSKHTEYRYYTFGWSGLLSEKQRELSAQELYNKLKELHAYYTNEADSISFELHTHSHGAQLALYLGAIWKQKNDRHFTIERIVLSAPPLYYQKAQHAYAGLFKQVINIYSEGDTIQIMDCISTPQRRCYRTFQKTGPIPSGNTESPLIADICIAAHHDTYIFGHGSFFTLNRYHMPHNNPKKNQIIKLIKALHPLPLISFYPAFLYELIDLMCKEKPSGYHSALVDMSFEDQNIYFTLTDYHPDSKSVRRQITIACAQDIYASTQQEAIDAYHTIGYYSEFNKTIAGIKDACKTLASKKKLRRKKHILSKKNISKQARA